MLLILSSFRPERSLRFLIHEEKKEKKLENHQLKVMNDINMLINQFHNKSIINERGSNENLILFIRGNDISGEPNIKGIN